jgi:hypothetical protein
MFLLFDQAHDGLVHAVDIERECAVWQCPATPLRHPEMRSSFFSSPAIDSVRRRLLIGSLGGHLLCLRLDVTVPAQSTPEATAGVVCAWQASCPAPLFSSPAIALATGASFVGCVDGTFYN